MARGHCRDHPPEVFFPSDGAGVQAACRICSGCPVAGECLEFALEGHIRYGVWGGASERARQRIAAERRRDAEGPLAAPPEGQERLAIAAGAGDAVL